MESLLLKGEAHTIYGVLSLSGQSSTPGEKWYCIYCVVFKNILVTLSIITAGSSSFDNYSAHAPQHSSIALKIGTI